MQSNLTVQSETEGNPSQLAAIEDVLALRGPNSPARDGVISPSSCDSDTVYHQTAKVTNKSTASDLEARLLQETGFPLTEPGSESRPAEAKDLGRKTESPRDLYASKSDLSQHVQLKFEQQTMMQKELTVTRDREKPVTEQLSSDMVSQDQIVYRLEDGAISPGEILKGSVASDELGFEEAVNVELSQPQTPSQAESPPS